jgi:hypothetical protein
MVLFNLNPAPTSNLARSPETAVDFSTQEALCTRIFSIPGGTGRFKNASGNNITLSMTVAPVVPNKFVFLTVTATFMGTVSGQAIDQGPQDGQQ